LKLYFANSYEYFDKILSVTDQGDKIAGGR